MKHSFYFGHKWLNSTLTSSLKVEDLLYLDKDLYAIVVLVESEDDLKWYWINPDREFKGTKEDFAELDRYRVEYVAKLVSCIPTGHTDDCSACTRCHTETLYLKALNFVKQFKSIDKADLIAIIMAYEGKFNERNRYAELYCKSRLEQNPTENVHSVAFKLFPMPSGSMESRQAYWNTIDPECQQNYHDRALQFIESLRSSMN